MKIEQAGDLVIQAEQGFLVNHIYTVKTHLNELSKSLKNEPVSNRVSRMSRKKTTGGRCLKASHVRWHLRFKIICQVTLDLMDFKFMLSL